MALDSILLASARILALGDTGSDSVLVPELDTSDHKVALSHPNDPRKKLMIHGRMDYGMVSFQPDSDSLRGILCLPWPLLARFHAR